MRWLVTGTDTEVGKTVVTACLAQAAPGAVALKPVASGVAPGSWGEDAELLAEAAGHRPRVHTRLQAPLSPHRAADLEGVRIDPDALVRWIDSHDGDPILVEGVGGWLVPITWSFSVEDLAVRLGAPVVVVAADRLGVLNHTLLTVRAVQRAGLRVAGVVLNRLPGPDELSRSSNLADLRALLDVPVVPLPPIAPTDPDARRHAGEVVWDALR